MTWSLSSECRLLSFVNTTLTRRKSIVFYFLIICFRISLGWFKLQPLFPFRIVDQGLTRSMTVVEPFKNFNCVAAFHWKIFPFLYVSCSFDYCGSILPSTLLNVMETIVISTSSLLLKTFQALSIAITFNWSQAAGEEVHEQSLQ